MNDNKQSSQSRFLIAAVLSMVVLLGWGYFFAPKKPDNANANVNANVANTQTAQTTAPVQATPTPQTVATTPDNTPN